MSALDYTVSLGLLSLTFLGCSGSRAAKQPDPPAGMQAGLVVRRGEFRERFLVTGELDSVRSEVLSVPRVPTWQTTIRWMETDGTPVVAGRKVVELDSLSFLSNLDEKKMQLIQAESDLEQKQAEISAQTDEKEFQRETRRIALEMARKEAEIPEELLARRDYQERQLNLRKARVEYDKALEDLESKKNASREDIEQRKIACAKARGEIEVAERAIGALTLAAPRDGILVVSDHPWEGRKLQIGDTVWVGLPVMQIPDLSEMRVEAELSDVDDGRISMGMPASCTLDAYPDLHFPGTISEITPVAQEAGEARQSLRRAFHVRIALERSDPGRMRPGMSVKVEVTAGRTPGALLAPRAALDLDAHPPCAFLEDGSSIPVRLGACNALECVVREGVPEGARLRARG